MEEKELLSKKNAESVILRPLLEVAGWEREDLAVPLPKPSPSQTQTLPGAGRTLRGDQARSLSAIGLLSGGGARSLPPGPLLLEDLAGRGVHPSGGDHREGSESGTAPFHAPTKAGGGTSGSHEMLGD